MQSQAQPPRLIALWSPPRCRSTAFLRMIMERGDLQALHEPFSNRADFGSVVVDGLQVATEADLIATLVRMSERAPVFFKDTTDFHYPQVLADQRFLREAVHTFIVRDPRDAIASHFALDPDLTRDAVGFARLFEIHQAVAAATGGEPVVIDADDLVDRPEATVKAYCHAVGLPFDESHLSWDRGDRQEWEKTRRWHVEAGSSTTFARTQRQYAHTVDNHPRLAEFYAFHLPYYEELRSRRLRAG